MDCPVFSKFCYEKTDTESPSVSLMGKWPAAKTAVMETNVAPGLYLFIEKVCQ